jgi:lactate racemase
VENPAEIIRQKLYNPDCGPGLAELVKGRRTVAVAHTDITRATPNHILIPVIVHELRALGIKKEDIILVNMTGSHRPQTGEELARMLGQDIVADYKCVQHNSFDKDTMMLAGDLDGFPLYINKEFMAADFKICTGFIEPHFFAGFSGGPKAVLPGLCDIDTIMRNHNAKRIGDENATWGITRGNPVWENIRDGCNAVNPDFLVNVAMNTHEEISGVFTGEWEPAHKIGYEFVRKNAMQKVNKRYDIVITSNSGYPLDMNLYQCVKGMSCAAQIVKENGIIIIAGECADGLPKDSPYEKILKTAGTPGELFDRIIQSEETLPEQWQAQIQTRIQKKAKVYVCADRLSDDEIKQALLLPCRDIEALVAATGGSVAVIPKGPQTIPYYA